MDMTYLRIGEFSELTGISKRMLRHYEKLELLHPATIDTFTGYRYYHSDQYHTINRITSLQEFGFSLKEIYPILEKPMEYQFFMTLLKDKEAKLRIEQDAMTRHLLKLEYFIKYAQSHPDSINNYQSSQYQVSMDTPNQNDTHSQSKQRSMIMTKDEIKQELSSLLKSTLYEEKMDEAIRAYPQASKYFITLDIDKFMNINDDYGFDIGDQVIYRVYKTYFTAFSELLQCNQLNNLTRLGGDEFAILIIGADDIAVIDCVAETLANIKAYDFSTIGCPRQVTCSIGIAKSLDDQPSMVLRHNSTKALLDAKRNGKDGYSFIDMSS